MSKWVKASHLNSRLLTLRIKYSCYLFNATLFTHRNVAEALVSKGLATVIRYRQDDDQRSSHYDELLAAEARAVKKGAGLHSKKEAPIHRVADVSGVSVGISQE